jgi:hypothetical protein
LQKPAIFLSTLKLIKKFYCKLISFINLLSNLDMKILFSLYSSISFVMISLCSRFFLLKGTVWDDF